MYLSLRLINQSWSLTPTQQKGADPTSCPLASTMHLGLGPAVSCFPNFLCMCVFSWSPTVAVSRHQVCVTRQKTNSSFSLWGSFIYYLFILPNVQRWSFQAPPHTSLASMRSQQAVVVGKGRNQGLYFPSQVVEELCSESLDHSPGSLCCARSQWRTGLTSVAQTPLWLMDGLEGGSSTRCH